MCMHKKVVQIPSGVVNAIILLLFIEIFSAILDKQ